jgi:outer membrane protein OmpA-like peptidoglycan-associated protein
VSDEAKSTLEPAAEALIAEERLKLQLRGHADPSGNTEYNAIIARARCEVVRDFLVEKGVNPQRITVISFGDTQSAGSGKTAAELRRVDAIFSTE